MTAVGPPVPGCLEGPLPGIAGFGSTSPLAWLALAGAVAAGAGGGRWGLRTARLAASRRLERSPVVAGTVRFEVVWGRAPALVLLAVVSAAGWLADGPAVAASACAVLGCCLWLAHRARAGRRGRAADEALARAVRLLVAELESGAGPPAALAAAADVDTPAFALAAEVARRGGSAADVLVGAAEPGTALAALGQAWRIGESTGVPLAGVLDRVGRDLAATRERRRVVDVALAGPRSSAALLAGLPVLGIGLGAAMGADPFAFLFGSAAGRAVLLAGVILDVAGVLWMARILARAGSG